jgi:tRNA wybutosine-synthesizing protein 2
MAARGRGVAPAERVRARVRARVGESVASRLPSGYERWGPVLVVRLADAMRPHFREIGEAYREELGARVVYRRAGPVAGEERIPALERLAGDAEEAEVVESGVRYRFDPERLLFARGNRTERARAARVTRPGETVVDLFAGIGYFVLPALVGGRASRAVAIEKNPLAFRYLVENARRNGVEGRISPRLGDNREVPLESGIADRVFLGYLPSAIPWIPVALPLLRRDGGVLHVHLVRGAREPLRAAEALVADAVGAAGGSAQEARARFVKAYGPGRNHVVVDARTVPPARAVDL